MYSYVFQDPVNLVDLDGKDIWIEGSTSNEVPLHQSINVGNPFGKYISFSFGRTEYLNGVVYRDTSLGGAFVQYKKTTPQEDEMFLKKLFSELGTSKIYGFEETCRSYSQSKFDEAPGVEVLPVEGPVIDYIEITTDD